jgi:hypothetical protein
MKDLGITILGAGMAGFGAAHRLEQEGVRARLYEARPKPGGHTSTHFCDDGFTFDEGPHISFTADTRLQELFARNIDARYEVIKAYVNNYWQGHWIKHPAQINLHGLPTDLVVSCIKDFSAASAVENPAIENYADWLNAAFGPTFARTFPMEYTKKYHTTEARNLTTDWLGPRLYRPSIDEVLLGALKPEPLDVHYVDRFRYPKEGGFVAYLRPLDEIVDLHCSYQAIGIDLPSRTLSFANAETAPFTQIVSSVPLPRLIAMIKGSPREAPRRGGPAGVLPGGSGQHRHRSSGRYARAMDVLLRRRHLLRAPLLSAAFLPVARAHGARIDAGGSVPLGEMASASRRAGGLDRAHHRRPHQVRAGQGARGDRASERDLCSVRQRDLRPGSSQGAGDGARLSERGGH